eukprot:4175597-Heterocapsa_arctica.AAC.1
MVIALLATEFPKPVADQHILLLRQHAALVEGPQELEEYVNICTILRAHDGLHSKIILEVTTEARP